MRLLRVIVHDVTVLRVARLTADMTQLSAGCMAVLADLGYFKYTLATYVF